MKEAVRKLGAEKPSAVVTAVALGLVVVGLATSVYLTQLYVTVSRAMAGGNAVDSFCNINEGMNCDAVAASTYSAFLGVPVAVWGLEYFGAALVLIVGCLAGWIAIRRWDAVLFILSLCGVPVTIALGWISATKIKSVCIMCMLVYLVNTLLVVVLALPERRRLRAFFVRGFNELADVMKRRSYQAITAVVAVFVLSQLVWMPEVMGRRDDVKPSLSVSEVDSAQLGRWKGIEAKGKTLGPRDAPIHIEEFTDFQCPYCSVAHDTLIKVVQKYSGKIHLVHRDFPLDQACNPMIERPFHVHACLAATYARCAAQQEKFWPYETLLFHNQRKLAKDSLNSFATAIGLDQQKLQACVQADATRKAIDADIAEGRTRGVTGTPAIFVNGQKVVGAKPIEFWDELIQSLLHPKTDSAPSAASASPSASVSAEPSAVPSAPPQAPPTASQ